MPSGSKTFIANMRLNLGGFLNTPNLHASVSGVGVLFIPLGVHKLDISQNWHGLMYALSGISGLIVICGIVYRPHKETCHR